MESASGFLDELQERFLGDQEAKHVCDDAWSAGSTRLRLANQPAPSA